MGAGGYLNLDGTITPLPSSHSKGGVTKIRMLPPFLHLLWQFPNCRDTVGWEAIETTLTP
jgi:hypothetical protein